MSSVATSNDRQEGLPMPQEQSREPGRVPSWKTRVGRENRSKRQKADRKFGTAVGSRKSMEKREPRLAGG